MIFSQPRLVERRLADAAVIRVPRATKEVYKGGDDRQPGRIVFAFEDTYFWGSIGPGMAYKQQLYVSVMASDATDAEYEAYPHLYRLSYDKRTTVRKQTVGSGTLTVSAGRYQQNTMNEPSHTFAYVDRARRLQIVWHAAEKAVDLDERGWMISRMISSGRIQHFRPTSLRQGVRIKSSPRTQVSTPKYTGLKCPSCRQPFAEIEHLTTEAITFRCPACAHRWHWLNPRDTSARGDTH